MTSSRQQKKIVLLDGGLGSTLIDNGLDIANDPLWSGKILVTQPEQVTQVHREFIQAGCEIIITGTYQVNVDNLMSYCNLSLSQAEETIFNSVQIAREAVEIEKSQCLVAASIGPYGATLHDGSEFNGWYTDTMTIEQFKDWHRPRIAIVARAEPDLLAFETIPSKKEAEALVELLREFPNLKAWLAFNSQDCKMTSHGEPIEEAVTVCLKSRDQIMAVGVNCVHPSTVVPLMKRINHLDQDLIAYPNAGVVWDEVKGAHSTLDQSIAPFVPAYIEAGIKYIGGCCHVNPADIRKMKDAIDNYVAKQQQ